MDIVKILKLVGYIATAVSTASGIILKPKLDVVKDEQLRRTVEEAVANAIRQEKGL